MDSWVFYIVLIILAYLGIALIAFFVQDLFLFHPEKLKRDFIFRYDIPFEEIILKGTDNTLIDGLFFPVENSEEVVFYFKGNTRSIKGWAKFARDFTSKGFSVFMIDYPGFGKSTGYRSEDLINKNTQVAYEWLRSKYQEKNIIIYGRSLGSGFAAHTACRNNPKMLILDSPFFDIRSLVGYYTKFLRLGWIIDYKVPLNEYAGKCTCPVFILHGDRDRIIPHRFSREIVKLDPDRIILFTVSGAGHNNLPRFKDYHDQLSRILHDDSLFQQYSTH